MTGNYFFSIIIPTYNEEADIRRTLEACVAVAYPRKEIIVVDDSSDNTPSIIKEYESRGVRLIHRAVNAGGRSGARNVGVLESKGDVLVILNADVFPSPDFLDRLLPHYHAGADYVLVESQVANSDRLFARFVQALYHDSYDGQDWIEWTEGFSCRRQAAIQVGLFPSNTPIPLCAGEDGHFGCELHAHGYKKVIDRSITISHVAPDTFSGYWKARKEKCSPVTNYFLHHKPLWRLSIKAFVKVSMLFAQIFLVIPVLISAFRLARLSPRGLRDVIPFFYAYSVQSLAYAAGEWEGMHKIIRYALGKKNRPLCADSIPHPAGEKGAQISERLT